MDRPDDYSETGEPSIKDYKFINLDMVREIEDISLTSIRLRYSENHATTIQGNVAGEIALLVMGRSTLPNGEPFPLAEEDDEDEEPEVS